METHLTPLHNNCKQNITLTHEYIHKKTMFAYSFQLYLKKH